MRVALLWLSTIWPKRPVCQETVPWTSVSDCRWCHRRAQGRETSTLVVFTWAPALWKHSLSVTPTSPTPPPPSSFGLHCTSAERIWAAELAPLREHSLGANAGQMWGDMRCCWTLWVSERLLKSSAGNTEPWNTWVFLFYFNCAPPPPPPPPPHFLFPPLECLMSCVVTGPVLFLHVWCHGSHWALGSLLDGAPDGVEQRQSCVLF